MRLAIITTHPIQYYAPIFKLLNQRNEITIQVFYTWGRQSINKYDPGFGKQIAWDIPLLEGYPYQWVPNVAKDPGSHHYKGIVNPGLVALIKDYNPHAILVFGWAYHSHLKAIRYFKNRVPVFFRGDSTLLDEKGGIRSFVKSILLKWVYKHVDHAFYVGTNNKAYFKKFGLKDTQLSFAPHSIDNNRFAANKSLKAEQFRQGLGLHQDDLLILFAGKFEDKKAPLLLLNAFLLLNRPNIHLLFTGNGILEEPLKVTRNKNIHFLDFQNQTYMPVVYQACNLYCLPSGGPGETWGLAVNEAMACSKAILVSDKVGCAIDLVKPSHNGAIFKSGNITDLLRCLEQLTNNKKLLIEYGKQSRLIIESWNFLNTAHAIENKLIHETY